MVTLNRTRIGFQFRHSKWQPIVLTQVNKFSRSLNSSIRLQVLNIGHFKLTFRAPLIHCLIPIIDDRFIKSLLYPFQFITSMNTSLLGLGRELQLNWVAHDVTLVAVCEWCVMLHVPRLRGRDLTKQLCGLQRKVETSAGTGSLESRAGNERILKFYNHGECPNFLLGPLGPSPDWKQLLPISHLRYY